MRRILEPGRNCWLRTEAHDAGVIIDARDYYRAFYKAASRARRYIAITGWQFDSDVALLRGEESEAAQGEVRMLPLLRELCQRNPELHVYILAWDFSLLLAMEREWMQELLFNWHSERLSFRFDASAPLYASHHDAINAAERLIYLENQYFSSRVIFQALVRRMREPGRGRLNIVFVLPRMPEALREQLAMGVAQVRMLGALRRVAEETGHSLGVYCSAASAEDGTEVFTYIHSKVMMVDDRFLTLGSANTTNRSMGLDSELNLAWEAAEEPEERELRRTLRRLRVSLLAEHAGLTRLSELRELVRADTLVSFLDGVAERQQHRLRPHPLETVFDQSPLLKPLEPEAFIIDPEDSVLDEGLFESLKQEQGLLASSFRLFTRFFVSRPPRPHPASLPAETQEAASEP